MVVFSDPCEWELFWQSRCLYMKNAKEKLFCFNKFFLGKCTIIVWKKTTTFEPIEMSLYTCSSTKRNIVRVSKKRIFNFLRELSLLSLLKMAHDFRIMCIANSYPSLSSSKDAFTISDFCSKYNRHVHSICAVNEPPTQISSLR